MIIELLCRYRKDPDDEMHEYIEDELKTLSIVKGDSFDHEKEYNKLTKQNKLYDYGPFLLNLKDVKFVNQVDKNHTLIRFNSGDMFVFKIQYEQFKLIYQSLTSYIIRDFSLISNLDKIITDGQ